MPILRGRSFNQAFFDEAIEEAAKFETKKVPMPELRKGRIILEGDIKAKITGWYSTSCVVSYGKLYNRKAVLLRRFMNFRYLRKKVEAVHAPAR